MRIRQDKSPLYDMLMDEELNPYRKIVGALIHSLRQGTLTAWEEEGLQQELMCLMLNGNKAHNAYPKLYIDSEIERLEEEVPDHVEQ